MKATKANNIVPYVWISDLETALDDNFIRQNNIKTVINVTEHAPFINPQIKQFRIPIQDVADENDILLGYLPMAVSIIEDSVKDKQNVLVHCHQGISRSCSVVASYLMKQNGCEYTVDDAVHQIRRRRKQAFIWGVHFRKALEKYHKLYC